MFGGYPNPNDLISRADFKEDIIAGVSFVEEYVDYECPEFSVIKEDMLVTSLVLDWFVTVFSLLFFLLAKVLTGCIC